MADLSMFETFDGGDIVLMGNDLQLVESLYNQPFLGLFGGNVKQSTPIDSEETPSLERFDWWGNQLFYRDSPGLQLNSSFERLLDNVSLNSDGLQELNQVGKKDLRFIEEIGAVEFSVSVNGNDRIRVDILLIEPDTLQERNFVFLWNGTKFDQIIKINSAIVFQSSEAIVGEGTTAIGEGEITFKLI